MKFLSLCPAVFCVLFLVFAAVTPARSSATAPVPTRRTLVSSSNRPPDHGSAPGRALPPRRSWPLDPPPHIIRDFAPPAHAWDPGHRGVDLAASVGQPVLAPADGVIAFAGQVAGTPVVTIRHGSPDDPNAMRSTYQPVTSDLSVGTRVRAGQVVGKIAAGPFHCARPCLHWGLLAGRRYLDPLGLLQGRLRLLPVVTIEPEADAPGASDASRSRQGWSRHRRLALVWLIERPGGRDVTPIWRAAGARLWYGSG